MNVRGNFNHEVVNFNMLVFTKCVKYLGIFRDVMINRRLRGFCYSFPQLSNNSTGIYNMRFTAERLEQGNTKKVRAMHCRKIRLRLSSNGKASGNTVI